MIYHHPTSPKGTQLCPRCTTLHPGSRYRCCRHPNTGQSPSEAHKCALSAELTSTNTTQTAPNPHRRHTPAHPRRRLSCRRGKTIISRPGAPPHSTGPPHICATPVCPTPYATQVGHTALINRASAYAKRAPHCAMCTVKRPETLDAVRTTTRHGELDKEFSQSPTTAEPQSRQRPAWPKLGQPSRPLAQPEPDPGPGPTAASPRPLHPDRNRRRSRHAARPR